MTNGKQNIAIFQSRGTIAYTADDVQWQAHAICNGQDPERWFPAEAGRQGQIEVQRAIEGCATCPRVARQGCARLAIDQKSQYGVWAGVYLGNTSISRAAARKRLRTIAGLDTPADGAA